MKFHRILFITSILTSCSIIYANRSFVYQSVKDWKNMTPSQAQTILDNGGSVKTYTHDNYPPLTKLCKYNTQLNLVKLFIKHGANKKDCHLDDYIKNISSQNDYPVTYQGVSILVSLGITPTSAAEDIMLEKFPNHHKEIISFFDKHKVKPSLYTIQQFIQKDPENYKKILAMFHVKIPHKDVVLWRLNSPVMQQKRGSAEWYRLVDEVKKFKVKNDEIGMSKEEYILSYGTPDQEYKINNQSTILIYNQEYKKNIPLQARTHYYSSRKSHYIRLFNDRGESINLPPTDISEIIIYIDKNIVTGSSNKLKTPQ